MNDLVRLAELIRQRNAVERKITTVIGRPVTTGHLGEFIASKIFRIRLADSASKKDIDGQFRDGPLVGRSVNIKFYPKHDGLLALSPDTSSDFILVLAGPKSPAASSRGQFRPCVIESVFLFDTAVLVASLKRRGVKFGPATSIRQHYWEAAEIYPLQRSNLLVLSEEQRLLLALFKVEDGG
jgi:hypothetical protein